MSYDEELAVRVRELIGEAEGVSEKRMFGGLAFLIHGNLAVAASAHGGLLLRVPPQETDALTADPHAERMVMRGREMDGWLRIEAAALATREGLERWVSVGVSYARTLPPKAQ